MKFMKCFNCLNLYAKNEMFVIVIAIVAEVVPYRYIFTKLSLSEHPSKFVSIV